MAEVRITDAPQGVRTFYDKGVAAMERGNFDYAMDMFEAALAIEPRLLGVRKLLHSAAIRKAKANPPGKLAAAKTMGSLLKHGVQLKKKPLAALKTASTLMRSDPLNPRIAKALCAAAEAAGLTEAAILALESLRENSAANADTFSELARLYQATEQFDREYECRSEIARLKPNDSTAQKELKDAAARLTMGKAGWQKAASYRDVMRKDAAAPVADPVEALRKQLEQEPSNPGLRCDLADALLRGKRYGEAIDLLEAGLADGKTPDPRFERKLQTAKEHRLAFDLAQAEDANDKTKAAELRREMAGMRIENAERQAERYPSDLQLKFDLGKLLLEGGRLNEAIQQFQLAQRNPQRRVRSLLYLAQAFMAKGQRDVAIGQLETALGEWPTMDETRKEVLYELGLAYESVGQAEKAAQCFREIYAADIGYRDVAQKTERRN